MNTALSALWHEGGQRVLYIGTDGDIHELFTTTASAWTDHTYEVVHAVAPNVGAALNVMTAAITAFYVNFFGVDGQCTSSISPSRAASIRLCR